MAEDQEPVPPADPEPERESVADALRTAVERTLAATSAPAVETRQRARELLDEVSRRGQLARDEVGRRGAIAREEVSRRGEEATTRLAEALAELGSADREDVRELAGRIVALERRIELLERRLEGEVNPPVESESRGSGAPPGADRTGPDG
jgi:polyhydroxyalkanoate synthesis regulator phasin